MPIAATDLKLYGTANHAENDTATQGGAISTVKKLEFTQIAANDDLEALSDNAGDTMNLTITARSTAGAIVSETKALTGTTAAIFSTIGVVERFLKAVLASAATGTITIRRSVGGATVATLAPGQTEARLVFYDAASESGSTTRYEKGFFKNEHGSLTLNSAAIKLTADPSAVIRVGSAPSKGDTATATNRKTAPASVTFVDDGVSQAIPTGALAAGETIGVWFELALAADAAAAKSSLTVELSGTTI